MSFNEFIYENNIVGVTIGTVAGFGISNLIKDVNREVVVKLMNYLKIGNVGLLSSLVEFFFVMVIVYVLYKALLYPIFKKEIEAEKKEIEKRKQWRSELLDEVKTLEVGNVYFD